MGVPDSRSSCAAVGAASLPSTHRNEIGVVGRSEAPIGKCVVAPMLHPSARGATGGDVRAFEVDIALAQNCAPQAPKFCCVISFFRGPNFAKFGCKFYFRTDFVLHFEMRNYCTKKRILYKQACFSCFTPSALITCGSCTLFIHCIAENIHATVDCTTSTVTVETCCRDARTTRQVSQRQAMHKLKSSFGN